MSDMFLYGASGHARVVADVLETQGIRISGVVDDNPQLDMFGSLPVLHSAEGFSPFIVTIGDCRIRKRVVERLGDVAFGKAIHKASVISPSACIGNGSVVMAGAVIQPGAVIGEHCIINTGASVDHDCKIAGFVHVAPHCTLCGDVSIGEGTWIGAGSTVIQGIHIGRNCFIGAGSVVVGDIPDDSFCFGNPCRVIRNNDKGHE